MNRKFGNMLRSFGMSGYQVTSDLQEIEKTFNIELGHARASGALQEQDFYPQFEQKVRAEAGDMARHYEAFYCLEKSIRSLIVETMAEVEGNQWWDSGRINSTIATEVGSRIQKEIDSGVTGDRPNRSITRRSVNFRSSSRRTGIFSDQSSTAERPSSESSRI